MMKIVVLAMIIILINIAVTAVTAANIFGTSTGYFEPRISEIYTERSGTNISSFSEDQQFTESMGIFDIILGSVSFNWIIQYVPTQPLKEAINNTVILGLNAFIIFLSGVAILELFMKRANILG